LRVGFSPQRASNLTHAATRACNVIVFGSCALKAIEPQPATILCG
jgi:hypothetical protein